MRRALALLVISAAAIIATPTIASGGLNAEMDVDLVSFNEPLRFEAKFAPETCEQGDFDYEVTANGDPVTPVSATQDSADADRFVFQLPNDTPPGELEIQITCDNGDGETFGSETQDWGALAITKVVTGPAPTDAAFTVHVDCVDAETTKSVGATDISRDFDTDLHYTGAGGLHYVYTDHEVDCTITEPANGGAGTTTIVPPNVTILTDDEAPVTATVTDRFPEPIALQPNFTG